jgi:hypothetical protein
MSNSSIITQMVIAVIKAFNVPITAKRQIRVDSFTLSCSLVFILLKNQNPGSISASRISF